MFGGPGAWATVWVDRVLIAGITSQSERKMATQAVRRVKGRRRTRGVVRKGIGGVSHTVRRHPRPKGPDRPSGTGRPTRGDRRLRTYVRVTVRPPRRPVGLLPERRGVRPRAPRPAGEGPGDAGGGAHGPGRPVRGGPVRERVREGRDPADPRH